MLKKLFSGLLILSLLTLLVWAMFEGAWLSDDAYITYRTVDNWVNGYGLRWNVAERVQTYTHPLWMMLNAGAYTFTKEIFYTGMSLGIAVSLLAALTGLLGVARGVMNKVLFLALLLLSRAFLEFTTSGLENPLTHLLLALFVVLFLRPQWSGKVIFGLSLVAALGMVNRLDTGLLFLPALACVWLSQRSARCTALMAAGLLPLAAWLGFALVYYGAPFPNAYYAKLGTGIDPATLATRGWHYLAHSLQRDALTLLAIGFATVAVLLQRRWRLLPLLAGALLYLLYVVKIGGDFMSGRFLTAPFFLAALLLVSLPPGSFRRGWQALIVLALLSLSVQGIPFITPADFGENTEGFHHPVHHINDERRFYFATASWRNAHKHAVMPAHAWAEQGRALAGADRESVQYAGVAGFRCFFAGPQYHFIDPFGLTDPLLARLPMTYTTDLMAGHYRRQIPEGYFEGLSQGEMRLADPPLGEYYAHLREITRGPLWDAGRLVKTLRLNLGVYDSLIDVARYRFPPGPNVRAAELATRGTEGRPMDEPGNVVATPPEQYAIHIQLEHLEQTGGLELAVDGRATRELLFTKGAEITGSVILNPQQVPHQGLQAHKVRVPFDTWRAGYDCVRLLGKKGDPPVVLGHFRLIH